MRSKTTTWRAELADELDRVQDPGPVVAYAPSEAAFDNEFERGQTGEPDEVLAWTASRVYFPAWFEHEHGIGSAPRNPSTEGQDDAGN